GEEGDRRIEITDRDADVLELDGHACTLPSHRRPPQARLTSRSDLRMSSTSSRLSCWPSKAVMWSRPALSLNARLQVNVVTPSCSWSSIVSTASTSGQQLKCQVSTVRSGGSTSR